MSDQLKDYEETLTKIANHQFSNAYKMGDEKTMRRLYMSTKFMAKEALERWATNPNR